MSGCGIQIFATPVPTPRPPIEVETGVLFEDWPSAAAGPVAGADPKGLPPGFHEEFVFRALNQPMALRFLPDGRVIVAEQAGVLKLYPDAQTDAPVVLLDHRAEVFMREGSHHGLLGLAVDPDFGQEPYVYVLYARAAPIGAPAAVYGGPGEDIDECPGGAADCVAGARLSRFRFETATSLGAEQVLVEDWCSSAVTHSIGSIVFGPDGALLASGGEAGHVTVDWGHVSEPPNLCGDPPVPANQEPSLPDAEGGSLRSQDLRTRDDPTGLDGTIIRVNRETGEALPDNPLASDPEENARRIVAYGLRNPFRFVIRPGTSEIWIADVGWEEFEEINRIVDPLAGPPPNFGWPCYEGPNREPHWEPRGATICQDLYDSPPADLAFPTLSFARGPLDEIPCVGGGAAMSGLAFYDGDMFPDEYDGALFLADQQLRCMWTMTADANGLPDPATIRQFRVKVQPIDIQIGPDGALYYVDRDQSAHRIYYEPL